MKESYLTFEEVIAKSVEKIEGDVDKIAKFTNRALDIQKEAYDEEYANKKYEFSKAVLEGVGAPKEMVVALDQFHETALEEIHKGMRMKPIKNRYIREKNGTTIRVNKVTGDLEIVITIGRQDLFKILGMYVE
jgi:hypothetical protein